jgi:hypothetical protein
MNFYHIPSWQLFIAFAMIVGTFVVFPFVRSRSFRPTPFRVAALVLAIGMGIYNHSWISVLVFIMPLSLIWFPEHWGNYTGFFQGQYIDQKTPPVVISCMGWFFLIVFPLLLYWISRQ